MSKVKIYEYEKCDSCRKALKFLMQNEVEFERVPIWERPPSRQELRAMLGYLDGDLRRLFNTSGQAYRELGIGEKMKSKSMSESEAIALLAGNGKLIKRPFLISGNTGTVGFKEAEWKKIFKRH